MKLSEIILKTFGWKLMGDFPEINKSVVTLAPHTSNWDFVVGRLYLNAKSISNNTLMKKEMFFFPFNLIMNALGAIPIDRKNKKNSVVSQVATNFQKRKEFNVFIAAEGSRSKTTQWKTGFYYIAHAANVPIVISYIDYKKKEVGIKGIISDTSNIGKTMIELSNVYKNMSAKYPKDFTLDNRFS